MLNGWLVGVVGLTAVAGAQAGPSRGFRMGFTPFPHDMTLEALADTRDMLRQDADLVAAHFEGVPWPEALSGAPFHENLVNEWKRCEEALGPGSAIYLALTPLDMGRAAMGLSRGEREGMPIPDAITGRALDDPLVMEAYTNYCKRAVEAFDPEYLAIGIEANELYHNRREAWDAYVGLHRHVYEAIKAEHPDLPAFASFTLHNMVNPAWRDRAEMLEAWKALMPWNDAVAVSYYPFMSPGSGNVAASLAWLEAEFAACDKPFVFAETGQLAEPLTLTQPAITLPGSPEAQAETLRALLEFAAAHETSFVNWFVARDYDGLWEHLKATAPEYFKIWRDCGLKDGQGNARPALGVWREWRAQPLEEVHGG